MCRIPIEKVWSWFFWHVHYADMCLLRAVLSVRAPAECMCVVIFLSIAGCVVCAGYCKTHACCNLSCGRQLLNACALKFSLSSRAAHLRPQGSASQPVTGGGGGAAAAHAAALRQGAAHLARALLARNMELQVCKACGECLSAHACHVCMHLSAYMRMCVCASEYWRTQKSMQCARPWPPCCTMACARARGP